MISFSPLIFATLASVLTGHTDHPECVMDNSLQRKDGTVAMEEQIHLCNIVGITNNIGHGTSGGELEVTAE
jgi:hypothetical protein